VADSRFTDRTAGWLGIAFLLTLLASEAALSLPDADATAADVTAFYEAHRTVIIGLQIAGVVACALIGLMAWRLRAVDRRLGPTGLILAATALAPALITMVIAVVADPARPARADRFNQLEPRGDDLLFAGIAIFAVAVAVALRSTLRWLATLAMIVAIGCVARLVLEALGAGTSVLNTLAPVSFLGLVAALSWLCFRGFPGRPAARP
jgi:hypothetical protein